MYRSCRCIENQNSFNIWHYDSKLHKSRFFNYAIIIEAVVQIDNLFFFFKVSMVGESWIWEERKKERRNTRKTKERKKLIKEERKQASRKETTPLIKYAHKCTRVITYKLLKISLETQVWLIIITWYCIFNTIISIISKPVQLPLPWYPICYDYVSMECRVQLDMSEGHKVRNEILQFISVAQKGNSYCFRPPMSLNNSLCTMLCKISFLTLDQNQL